MERYFKLSQHQTTANTEILAGVTTFFAMSYILFVNPSILSQTGMPFQAVFLATALAAAISTLVMGVFANVPYALAPGMGLNAFFTFTVVFGLNFSWQEALAMVFICGVFNVLITVTKIRKVIIKSIPESLQHAIGAGIGVFVAYIGIKNAGFIEFLSDAGSLLSVNNAAYNATQSTYEGGIFSVVSNGGIVPGLVNFTQPSALLALFGLALTAILMLRRIPGAILIGILATTIIGIPVGVVQPDNVDLTAGFSQAFSELGTTFGAALGADGLGALFRDPAKLPLVLMTIFAFSLADVFDTIGTFIGTGRRTGIFSAADEANLESGSGFSSKMDRALFADSIGTVFGAVLGTSNTTTYVESSAGIGAGGRTGLTSVVTALLFVVSVLFAPLISLVPAAATAPSLIIVGILMMSAFSDVRWSDLEEAIPSFFAAIFMAFSFSISYGIAAAFIFYVITKVALGKTKDIHPVVWLSTVLFLINFVIVALVL